MINLLLLSVATLLTVELLLLRKVQSLQVALARKNHKKLPR